MSSRIRTLNSGAKLAPFNSGGGGCQNCLAKTDHALQQIFISGHFFPKNVSKGGGRFEKNFLDIKKRVENIFFRT